MDLTQPYTEAAKNALFSARYEACLHGARSVEAEHVLLGLLRADLFELVSTSTLQTDQFRGTVEGYISRRAEVDSRTVTPLSRAAKRVLIFAAKESHNLSHNYVGTEHILLGLLTPRRRLLGLIIESPPLASRILKDSGFDVEEIVFRLRSGLVNSQSPRNSSTAVLGSRTLSEAQDP